MSSKRDYYEILGIKKSASLDEIRKAYREAVLRHHPDRVPHEQKKEAEEKFKEISEAYAVLSDSQKRALYDQYGHSGIDQKYAYEDIFKGTDFNTVFSDLGDYGVGEGLFDQLFGDLGFDLFGRRRKRKETAERGRDLQIAVQITLEEAASGVEKKIAFHRYDHCPSCSGSGAKPGTQMAICSVCKGQGHIVKTTGFVKTATLCPNCGGKGKMPTIPCPGCHGEGIVQIERKLTVKIPPGIETGSTLRIQGEGEAGAGGRGDLYVVIEIAPHPLFERQGADLLIEVKISLSKAILGGEVSVPTLQGKVKMKIPEGTQSHSLFRLKGKGLPSKKDHGDELVRVIVEIPRAHTHEQRQLIEEFEKLSPAHAK